MATGKEDLLQALIDAYLMEKGAREFYALAAQKSSVPEAKETFQSLAEWEDRHMDYIGHLYRAITEDRDVEGFEEFGTRAAAPVTEGGLPIKDLEARVEKYAVTDEMGAITLALHIESKAYNLYWQLSKNAPDTNAKTVFRSMMEQEVKHINELQGMMTRLSHAS